MPEGDTIFRAAARLHAVLEGTTLLGFGAPLLRGERPQPGETIIAVEAVGKHLLVRFSGGLTLETHMRMTGSWRTFEVREPPRRWGHDARVVLDTAEVQAVCFNAPIVRTWRRADSIAHLGPDLCRPDADVDEVLRRLATLDPGLEIGVVLLDQRVACGIGNVFKSEVLHACRVDPFAALGNLNETVRRDLVDTASRQLRANLGAGPRTTVPGGLAVYQRTGRSCPRCRTPIVALRQGEPSRTTYYCAACQVIGRAPG